MTMITIRSRPTRKIAHRESRCRSVRERERMIGSPALRQDGPGLTRASGAGLTLHSHLPTKTGLPVGSTSV